MFFHEEPNRIYAADENKKLIAEITFPSIRENLVDLNHTFVDPSLQGQGIAGELVRSAAELFRRNSLKAIVTCSYASQWFQKHPEYADVLDAYPGRAGEN